jgi:S1-C subfamily serine protease
MIESDLDRSDGVDPEGPAPGGPGDWLPPAWGTPQWDAPPPRPRRNPWAIAFTIVALTIVAILLASAAAYRFGRGSGFADPGATVAAPAAPSSPSSLGAVVDPALVDVTTTLGYQNAKAAGTGIVLTPNGEILTNHHVVAGATSVSVTDVGNGHTYSGSVVGYDATDDIAVVQLANASGLKTAKIGDSSSLTVGQDVVAIGNAGGVGGTPAESQGTVTGLNRSITAADDSGAAEQLTGLIQTSARLLSGDSGGPLVDSAGRVVGIDTAGSSRFNFRNPAGGQGYAIPVNRAISIAREITAGHGSSTVHIGPSPFLGVEVRPATSRNIASGADVAGVLSGTAAAKAGIAAGDVITSINGSRVTSPTDLSSILRQHHPGDRVSVGWTDSDGQPHTATVQLASGPVA